VSTAPFLISDYVRWSDCDPAGIIRYDAYLRFYEVAEAELFRAVGLPLGEVAVRSDVWLVRKVMHAEFHSPARLDERLEVETYVSRIGRSALTLNFDTYAAAADHTLRATGYLVLVAVDKRTYQKRSLPGEVVEALKPHLRAESGARSAED
jgi:YbgC/YbaW family acyl-CoA thioester hydrolase